MVANCWNRSGNSGCNSNCIHFLEDTFAILKNKTVGLNGHLLGWKPCKLLNAIALGQIKAMNKKTAFTAGLK
jgi:hypothetical protein